MTFPPVSLSFGDPIARAFFANLLPEGEIKRQVARQLGVSVENVFALLEGIGGDCAGAISLLPPGEPPGPGHYRPISPEDLARELTTLPAHPLLAGAQNKLPLYLEEGRFCVPEVNAPSSHILKTAIERLENTVVNEAFCMNLAQRAGLPVPRVEVVDIAGQQVYLIKRYDRVRLSSGVVERLHQEDSCQALGVTPEMKYEQEGGPGFASCFRLVQEWSAEPILDALNLLRWALFNLLIGNADAHAKNLSFLYRAGTLRLAPFYDLLSCAVYRGLNNRFAMKMGGQKDLRYLTTGHLLGFASEAGIGQRVVRAQQLELCHRLSAEVSALADSFRGTCRDTQRRRDHTGLLALPLVV